MTATATPGLTPTAMNRGQLLSGNLYGIASVLAWSAGFPAAESLLQRWDPLVMVAGRFAMALILLIPLWFLIEGGAALRRARWGRGMFVGAIGFGGGAWTILMSQAYTDPVTVAIFAAATPLCATVIDWIWLRKGFGLSFVLGLFAAVAGGIVATGGGMPGDLGLGALFAVASGFLFSWGSLMTVRDLPDQSVLGKTTVTAVGAALAIGLVIAPMHWAGQVDLPTDWPGWGDLGRFAVYGMLAFSLSQVLWVAATARLGLSLASFHINIAPFYTMLILIALGGSWNWAQATGALIVAVGVVLAQGHRPA